MGFSYFSYNQDYDDQEKEKEEVPSFSPSDYNNVDERRDILGINFFNLNSLVLSAYNEECSKTLNMDQGDDDQDSHKMNHDDDDDDDDDDDEEEEEEEEEEEGPRKIEWGYLEELIAELLDEFELTLDRSIMMDNGQSSCVKVQEEDEDDDDDSLEHHNDTKEFANDFRVDGHGLREVHSGHPEEQI